MLSPLLLHHRRLLPLFLHKKKAERYPDNEAAANGFGRRHLCEDVTHLLYEADYPEPSDMRVPGSWRLSVGGVSVPPPPTGADRLAEIARILSGPSESSCNLPRYATDSSALCTTYFEHRHTDQLTATNAVKPHGRHNFEGGRQWWGIRGRTLEAVLEHIQGCNSARYEYPPPPAFSRCRGQLLDAKADGDGVVLVVRLPLLLLRIPGVPPRQAEAAGDAAGAAHA
ncbi:Homeobox protein KNOX3 [Hordeum vulgare]|nr:Homeobox protein KNOX3 [Hordeum vulgare]